jgi:DNA-binding NtrC family response regulator/tetratricopeptide (TPR) repeat protein
MSAPQDVITQLFYAGEYGRILEDTRHLHPSARTDPSRTALIAQATFEAGDLARARALAMACIASGVAAARARGQLVLALCFRATGDVTEALQLHQSALRSAEEAGDDELQAWAAIHLLRHLFVSGRNIAAAVVPTTRAKASKAGSTHATAYLHATVAVGEGQAGRHGEARRHLQIATRLVDAKPHPWLKCSILSTRAAVALVERELHEVADCLEQLRTISRRHGLSADYARANVNFGNLALFTQQYDAAEAALQEASDSPCASLIAKITAAQTLAEVRLAQGRLADCEAILCQIDRTAGEAALQDVFAVRWGRLTRAQAFLRRGQAQAAIEQLTQLESSLRSVSDRALSAAFRVTVAQALVMRGDVASGARHLAMSMTLDQTTLPHVQGHFYNAAAAAVSGSNQHLADSLRSRAKHVTTQGAASTESSISTKELDSVSPPTTDLLERSECAVIVESIASLLGLGSNPRLLAEELRQTIARLGCSPRVALEHASAPGFSSSEELELLLPQRGSTTLRLACAVPATPDKAITLGSVMRVGQLSIELERLREAERQRAALWPDTSAEASAGAIFESDAMRDVLTVARRIADTSVPILITGETGTGKEVLARLIHAYSSRAKAVFVPFNCTSLSRDMMESQLFGHRKGSFTGATDHAPGVVRAANRGTLLLDEVGDMPVEVQPKLLRFLELGEIHPLGDPRPTQVDVRVIAATNVDLKSLISTGRFREDLYYRLSIVPLHVPPLRERRGEIGALASHYLTKYAREFGKGDLQISEEAMEFLLLFRWPGNVRQLANEMRRIAALTESATIVQPEHLSSEISGFSASRKAEISHREARNDEVAVHLNQTLSAAVEHVERAMIVNALSRANGVVERAAQSLGLSRKGLYLKRQRYQIDATADVHGDDAEEP